MMVGSDGEPFLGSSEAMASLLVYSTPQHCARVTRAQCPERPKHRKGDYR